MYSVRFKVLFFQPPSEMHIYPLIFLFIYLCIQLIFFEYLLSLKTWLFAENSTKKKIWYLPTNEIKKCINMCSSECWVRRTHVLLRGDRRANQIRLEVEEGRFLEEAILEVNFVRWIKVRPRRLWDERSNNKLLTMNAVLVWLSCYNKTLQTRWLLNSKNLLLTVLEAGKSRPRCRQIQCLMRTHFLVYRWPSCHCVLRWQKRWGIFQGPLLEGH